LINNRQNGRRRGRGGGAPRPNGSGNGPDRGNRLDSRARGNAAQLHEKYKALARDAQMQGDRVNTEYYLQFADHYFRVLSESRARFEEQQQNRPRRDDYQAQNEYQPQGFDQGQGYDQDEYEDEGEPNGNAEAREPERQERFERQDRYERQDRGQRTERPERGQQFDRPEPAAQQDRPERQPRQERFDEPRRGRGRPRNDSEDRGNQTNGAEAYTPERVQPLQVAEAQPMEVPAAERPRRGRRPKAEVAASDATEARIEMDRLPPAFGADAPMLPGVVEAASDEEKPRRRTRRPRSDAATVDILAV
jgi:hypothetical protein